MVPKDPLLELSYDPDKRFLIRENQVFLLHRKKIPDLLERVQNTNIGHHELISGWSSIGKSHQIYEAVLDMRTKKSGPYVIYLPSIVPFSSQNDKYWWKACLCAVFQNKDLKKRCVEGLNNNDSFSKFLNSLHTEIMNSFTIVADQINRGIKLFESNLSAQLLVAHLGYPICSRVLLASADIQQNVDLQKYSVLQTSLTLTSEDYLLSEVELTLMLNEWLPEMKSLKNSQEITTSWMISTSGHPGLLSHALLCLEQQAQKQFLWSNFSQFCRKYVDGFQTKYKKDIGYLWELTRSAHLELQVNEEPANLFPSFMTYSQNEKRISFCCDAIGREFYIYLLQSYKANNWTSTLFDIIPNANFLLSQGAVLGRLVEDHILCKFLESKFTFSSSFLIANGKKQPMQLEFTFKDHSIFFFYGNKAPVSLFNGRNVAYFPKSVTYPRVDFIYVNYQTHTIYLIQIFVSRKHKPIGNEQDFELLKTLFDEQFMICRVFFLSKSHIF